MQDQANQGTMDPKQGLGPQGCDQTGLRGQDCYRPDLPEPKLPRELKENLERETLDPKATKAAESLGRLRPEPNGKDLVRTDFERDIGRIIFSREFRFLRNKTQVFFDARNDHICTRLEHVMYVNYIGKTIARALNLNTDLVEAIALAHDLGHAPFGHSGERCLDRLLRENGADFSFHHEQHGLRVVDLLAKRHDRQSGLNLTFEVRDGIISHCGEEADQDGLCPNHFKTKEGLQGYMDRELGLGHRPAPATLEGCIVRLADRIAFVGRDLEDAFRAGLVDRKMVDPEISRGLDLDNGHLINSLVLDVIQASRASGLEKIRFSQDKMALLDQLMDFSKKHIYQHPVQQGYEKQVNSIIEGLFAAYMRLAEKDLFDPETFRDDRAHGRLIPETERDLAEYHFFKYKADHPDPEATPLRVVCDYLAGMTDPYAREAFQALYSN